MKKILQDNSSMLRIFGVSLRFLGLGGAFSFLKIEVIFSDFQPYREKNFLGAIKLLGVIDNGECIVCHYENIQKK